jgi:sarcosine oxidase subunit beta
MADRASRADTSHVIAETHACVIGAGVMGLFAACEIAHRGLDVLVVERGLPGHEASAANAGTLALQNKAIPAIPGVLRSMAMWQSMRDQTGLDVEYERRGGFRLAESDADESLERAVLAQRAQGLAAEMVYRPHLAREAPYLAPHIVAASYCPDDGMANPLAAGRALRVLCDRRRIRIRPQTTVLAINTHGDRDFTVRTTAGAIRARAVICAAGAWNADVAALVGVDLPLTTEVQQAMTTDAGPLVCPHIVTHIRGNLTVKQSRSSGKMLIGGAWHGRGDRHTGEKRVRRDTLIGNLAWAAHNVPAVAHTRLLRAWVGFEGRTPDRLLMTGSCGAPEGFYVVGCAGGGFTLSPFAGRLTAQHVAGETPDAEGEVFHIRRFAGLHAAANGV